MVRHKSARLLGATLFSGLVAASAQAQVFVSMETNLGNINLELYDDATPVTVANFLNYVNSGRYDGSFFHRSVPGFIVQGGGYNTVPGYVVGVTEDAAIVNEYNASRPNIRGTIAMAKQGGNPDSATSQWFFNLADNTTILDDSNNGGFTVFGRVLGDGMDVVDAIAALNIVSCGAPFTELPVIDTTVCPETEIDRLVTIERAWVSPYIDGSQAFMVNRSGNTVVLTAANGATIANVAVSSSPSPSDTPDDVNFREGFFSFKLHNVTHGGGAMVAMQLPADFTPNTYYMYGPTPDNRTPHWYEFAYDGRTGAQFYNNNFVVLNFVDGERGDSDLTANGQISDPGAPGITSTPAAASGGGGGCTLAHPGRSTMPFDFWLIGLLLGALRWYRVRTGTAWRAARTS